jgi:hypothetical protein
MSTVPASKYLKLNEWWNGEFGTPMLRCSKFYKIEGLKEYKVKVSACNLVSERLVCKVSCIDEDGISVERWVDENTGSFYTMNGQCKSSTSIFFLTTPELTGRLVPASLKRELEGYQRSNAYRWGLDDETES